MNKYKVIFNYSGEVTEMQTEADTNYNAIMKCLPVMAKRYGVTRDSMIRYFTSDRLNVEAKELKNAA